MGQRHRVSRERCADGSGPGHERKRPRQWRRAFSYLSLFAVCFHLLSIDYADWRCNWGLGRCLISDVG
jgi:hypothetical protein